MYIWDCFCEFSRAIWRTWGYERSLEGKVARNICGFRIFSIPFPRLHEGNNNALVPSSIHPSVSQISTQFKNSRPFFYFLPPCRYGFMLHCPRNPSKRARNERNIRLPFVSRVVATSTLISLYSGNDRWNNDLYKFHKDMVAEACCARSLAI